MNLELDELYLNPNITISKSPIHRWGVFAIDDIKKYDVLQESPYCTFTYKELRKRSDVVTRYTYDSFDNPGTSDLVLGFGFAALFNHSPEHNAAYELDTVNQVMRHYAVKDIPAGEEILINYGCEEDESDFGDY